MAAPILAAGIAAASAGAQVYATGKTNKKTREWNEMMYGRQRADALADWQMQNEYNSPAAQMARYKAAGLNPNLIYGQMDSGATIRPTDAKSWNPQTPDFGSIPEVAAQGLAAYQDYTLQQEQVKNMRAQRELMELEGVLKTLEAGSKDLRLRQDRELYDVAVQTAREKMFKLVEESHLIGDEVTRRRELHGPNLEVMLNKAIASREDAAIAKAQLEKIVQSGALDRLEVMMREKGLSYNDDLVWRLLAKISDGDLSIIDFLRNLGGNLFKYRK